MTLMGATLFEHGLTNVVGDIRLVTSNELHQTIEKPQGAQNQIFIIFLVTCTF